MQRGTHPSSATWEPPAMQGARAAVSSATKITSRLSTYFRTVPSCRTTRPNYSRLLLYLLMDAACVCPAYCTFPCKGLPHSLLCSELSSGLLPHTCWREGPRNTHSWKPSPGSSLAGYNGFRLKELLPGQNWGGLSWSCSAESQLSSHAAPHAADTCFSFSLGICFKKHSYIC